METRTRQSPARLRPPPARPRSKWHLPGRVRYPVWSVRTVLLVGAIVVALTAGLVFGLGCRTVFAEAEISAAIVAGCLMLFLTVGLYRGVRIRKETRAPYQVKPITSIDHSGLGHFDLPDLNIVDCPVDGGDEGCLSGILTLIFSLVVLVVLVMVLWALWNVMWVVVPVVAGAIYWMFYSALRIVFAKSRKTRGNWPLSVGYAFGYTVLYTGWLLGLLMLAQAIVR